MRPSIIPKIAVFLLGLWLTACATSAQGPTTWLDRPLDGDQVAPGPLTIQVHASDADGVARFEFLVNEVLLATVSGSGGRFGDAQVEWAPPVPGTYLVRARAVDSNGNVGSEASSHIVVGELAAATPTPAIAQSPTPTPAVTQPLTPTPIIAQPLTLTPTPLAVQPPTPSPAPVCPGPPVIASFVANPSTITAGQSSTLSWGKVDNAASAVIDQGIGGVGTPGSTIVAPATTMTYRLTATGCGGTVTKQVTVVVRAAPPPPPIITVLPLDITPPTISNAAVNPTLILKQGPGCPTYSRTTTVNAVVTDTGGVSRVVARYSGVANGEVTMTLIGGNTYQATLGPFSTTGTLSIIIIARDNAGNMAQTGPLTVRVQECIG